MDLLAMPSAGVLKDTVPLTGDHVTVQAADPSTSGAGREMQSVPFPHMWIDKPAEALFRDTRRSAVGLTPEQEIEFEWAPRQAAHSQSERLDFVEAQLEGTAKQTTKRPIDEVYDGGPESDAKRGKVTKDQSSRETSFRYIKCFKHSENPCLEVTTTVYSVSNQQSIRKLNQYPSMTFFLEPLDSKSLVALDFFVSDLFDIRHSEFMVPIIPRAMHGVTLSARSNTVTITYFDGRVTFDFTSLEFKELATAWKEASTAELQECLAWSLKGQAFE